MKGLFTKINDWGAYIIDDACTMKWHYIITWGLNSGFTMSCIFICWIKNELLFTKVHQHCMFVNFKRISECFLFCLVTLLHWTCFEPIVHDNQLKVVFPYFDIFINGLLPSCKQTYSSNAKFDMKPWTVFTMIKDKNGISKDVIVKIKVQIYGY